MAVNLSLSDQETPLLCREEWGALHKTLCLEYPEGEELEKVVCLTQHWWPPRLNQLPAGLFYRYLRAKILPWLQKEHQEWVHSLPPNSLGFNLFSSECARTSILPVRLRNEWDCLRNAAAEAAGLLDRTVQAETATMAEPSYFSHYRLRLDSVCSQNAVPKWVKIHQDIVKLLGNQDALGRSLCPPAEIPLFNVINWDMGDVGEKNAGQSPQTKRQCGTTGFGELLDIDDAWDLRQPESPDLLPNIETWAYSWIGQQCLFFLEPETYRVALPRHLQQDPPAIPKQKRKASEAFEDHVPHAGEDHVLFYLPPYSPRTQEFLLDFVQRVRNQSGVVIHCEAEDALSSMSMGKPGAAASEQDMAQHYSIWVPSRHFATFIQHLDSENYLDLSSLPSLGPHIRRFYVKPLGSVHRKKLRGMQSLLIKYILLGDRPCILNASMALQQRMCYPWKVLSLDLAICQRKLSLRNFRMPTSEMIHLARDLIIGLEQKCLESVLLTWFIGRGMLIREGA